LLTGLEALHASQALNEEKDGEIEALTGEITRLHEEITQLKQNGSQKRPRRAAAQSPDDPEIKVAAQKFTVMYDPWIPGEVWEAELDDDYEPANRFSSDENCIQAILRELLAILPEHLHELRKKEHLPWLVSQFCATLQFI
jgi:hypothetical protein